MNWLVGITITAILIYCHYRCVKKLGCKRKGCDGTLYQYDYDRWFCKKCQKEDK